MHRPRSLTDGSISRALLGLAFPIFCVQVLQSVNSAVSAFWVGRYLGEAAITAVANAQSLMIFLTGAAFGVTIAATLLVGQCLGANNVAAAKRVVATGLNFFTLLSLAMSLVGIAFTEQLLTLMKAAPESLPMAVPYMRVALVALPCVYTYAFVMALLRGSGDSKTPAMFMLLTVGLGAVLTPLFVLGIGPVPGAGVVGAAVATFVSQTTSLIALVSYLYRHRHPLCLYKDDLSLRMDGSIVGELIRKGIPVGAQVLVISFSSVLMIVLVNRFGVDTTAAYGALLQLWTYVQMPAFAIAVAVETMTAQNVGAQKWDRVFTTVRLGMMYGALLTGAMVLLVYGIDGHAYRVFLPDQSPALSIASHISSIVTWSFVILSAPMALFGSMRGAGAVIPSLCIYMVSLLALRFPLAALLIDHWGADGIWWSFPISCAVAATLAALYYRFGAWHRTGRLQIAAA